MGVLVSEIDTGAPAFVENDRHHRGLAADLRARLAAIAAAAPAASVATQRRRGKLLVRERLAALLDPGAPFLELSPLAAADCHPFPTPAAGIVTGIGRVAGRECVVVANDATVKGGTYLPETIKKHLRAQEIALDNRLACIYLVDSGGIFLPAQAETFADAQHFGRIFYNEAQLAAAGIPQIAVVLGMCTAGGAYVPAMADENIIVAGTGTIYLAGPPLVRAAIGEEVSAEELGGGAMHSRVSGVTDHLAETEAEALALCRDVVAATNGQKRVALAMQPPEAPRYPVEELYGLIPADPRAPYDVHAVLARLLDGSRLHPFKPAYGTELVCGFAHIMGYPVAMLANNGVLFGPGATKGAHFVQLACRRGVPLVFLQNITGFMVGRQVEQAGIIKDGAKMVQAVACAGVPRLTVLIGASHGAGNYAMCGRGLRPRFLFAWPNARTGVMGAAQAAAVMAQVRGGGAGDGRGADAGLAARIAAESEATYGSARLWDDGVIDPCHTREVLALSLSACLNAPVVPGPAPLFRF